MFAAQLKVSLALASGPQEAATRDIHRSSDPPAGWWPLL